MTTTPGEQRTGAATLDAMCERIDAVIRAYDAQGWHRTATAVDEESGEWLAGEVRTAGLEATLEPWPLSRIDPLEGAIEVGGRRIEGVPFFDSGYTDTAGISGRLTTAGGDGEIAVIQNAPNAHGDTPVNQARREGRYKALVVIAGGRSPGLALTNAPDFLAPFGPPVLQVSSEEGAFLLEQATQGAAARLVVAVTRTETRAYNVLASIPGRDPNLAPLVITTPRSGWWQCASERGGGIAAWLETIRALAAVQPERPVLFVAFSGHELGFLGVTMFLRQRPEYARRAHTWIHYGANIGAANTPGAPAAAGADVQRRSWGQMLTTGGAGGRYSAADDRHREMLGEAFQRAGVENAVAAPAGEVVGGESTIVAREGGRTIALVNGNALFHLPSDRYPEAVDIASVARQAAACIEVARALALEAGTAD